MAESRSEYRVIWTVRAVDKLVLMLQDARHAEGNREWVGRKLEECLTEAVQRLSAFPDLRQRYRIEGRICNGMTLRAFPVQAFYQLTKSGAIAVFSCRWARQDRTGPMTP